MDMMPLPLVFIDLIDGSIGDIYHATKAIVVMNTYQLGYKKKWRDI